jgi:PAS domain S-box-containing protein
MFPTRSGLKKRFGIGEGELRQLIDAIPQQVFVFDSDWSPLFANRRELDYTGLTQQEVHSKDAVAKIFHPDDLKRLEVVRERARVPTVPLLRWRHEYGEKTGSIAGS